MKKMYKESIQKVEFSHQFDKNTISKMTVALKNKRSKNKIRVLCGIAAVVVLIASIIAGHLLILNRHNYVLSHETQNINELATIKDDKNESITQEPVMLLSTQESIIEQQEYGKVYLSTRAIEEVQTLAKSAGLTDDAVTNVSCYEDEQYMYFFYDNGTIAGIMARYLTNDLNYEAQPWVKLSEDEAVSLAESALIKYCYSYTENTADRFTIETWNAEADDVFHFPEWRITFTEHTASDIERNTVSVEIDMSGNVAMVFFGVRSNISDENLEKEEYISEETAILLALNRFKLENREVDLEYFSVTAKMVEYKGSVAWNLYFEEKENADGKYMLEWRQIYWMMLDASTGEWISTNIAR